MADNFGGVTTSTFDAVGRLTGRELGGAGVTRMTAAGEATGVYDSMEYGHSLISRRVVR